MTNKQRKLKYIRTKNLLRRGLIKITSHKVIISGECVTDELKNKLISNCKEFCFKHYKIDIDNYINKKITFKYGYLNRSCEDNPLVFCVRITLT